MNTIKNLAIAALTIGLLLGATNVAEARKITKTVEVNADMCHVQIGDKNYATPCEGGVFLPTNQSIDMGKCLGSRKITETRISWNLTCSGKEHKGSASIKSGKGKSDGVAFVLDTDTSDSLGVIQFYPE